MGLTEVDLLAEGVGLEGFGDTCDNSAIIQCINDQLHTQDGL